MHLVEKLSVRDRLDLFIYRTGFIQKAVQGVPYYGFFVRFTDEIAMGPESFNRLEVGHRFFHDRKIWPPAHICTERFVAFLVNPVSIRIREIPLGVRKVMESWEFEENVRQFAWLRNGIKIGASVIAMGPKAGHMMA